MLFLISTFPFAPLFHILKLLIPLSTLPGTLPFSTLFSLTLSISVWLPHYYISMLHYSAHRFLSIYLSLVYLFVLLSSRPLTLSPPRPFVLYPSAKFLFSYHFTDTIPRSSLHFNAISSSISFCFLSSFLLHNCLYCFLGLTHFNLSTFSFFQSLYAFLTSFFLHSLSHQMFV